MPSQSRNRQRKITTQLESAYPTICNTISHHATAARAIVEQYEPKSLLIRGYWHWAMQVAGAPPEESRSTIRQHAARYCTHYVQKLICATGNQFTTTSCTDDAFATLSDAVLGIYDLLPAYFLCRSAAQRHRPDYDREIDELSVRLELHWTLVQGDRYQVHDVPHITDLIKPHEPLLQKKFRVGLAQLEHGLKSIQNSLTFGLFKAANSLLESHEIFRRHGEATGNLDNLSALIQKHAPHIDLNDTMDKLTGDSLFDVAKLTQWPTPFIQALSCDVGTDMAFITHPERGGWPTQPSLCDTRPFIQIQGKCYVFNHAHCMDVMYRAIERCIVAECTKTRAKWNLQQKASSEAIAIDLVTKPLPGTTVLRNARYPVLGSHGKIEWPECDALAICDNNILVIEVKAGAVTRKSPSTSLMSHIRSIKDLVCAPIQQGRRFVEALRQHGRLELRDAGGNPTLCLTNTFDSISVICITADQMFDLAPSVQHIRTLGVPSGGVPAWPISIDDLRVVTEILYNPIDYMHFMQVRQRAFFMQTAPSGDELDHLGAYLAHSDYVAYAKSRFPANSQVGWFGYRDAIDRFYHEQLVNNSSPPVPSQEMPPRFRQIIKRLAYQRPPCYIWAGTTLLNADADSRSLFCEALEAMHNVQRAQGRWRPISTRGDWRVTAFVRTAECGHLDPNWAIAHTCADLQLSGGREQLLLILDLTEDDCLGCWCYRVTAETCRQFDDAKLRSLRHQLFQTRRATRKKNRRR